MDRREHPYLPFLHEVKAPAKYLGGEPGEVHKDWDAASCRICLAFPDMYEIGMSHLGYKILYGLINGHPKLLAERAYAVWPDMEARLREHQVPLLSLESARPLREFDIVGFSLQFELTYTNILQMLELGGIPRWASERGEQDPLVIAGGPVATHAEPIAPFIDVFLIGDGEAKLPEVMLTWSALRDAGVPRAERLLALAKLGGLYVPALYETSVSQDLGLVVVDPGHPEAPYPVERTFVGNLDQYPFPSGGPVSATETIFDRVSVEVARGCTEGCRFCQAGMIYRPVRERSPQQIIDTIVASVKTGGYDEASLTSLSTADYSAIAPLVQQTMKALEGQRVNVSVSSLRAYGLSEDVLDDMKSQRAGGLTFAPEAGTQRMRDVVNKNVTEEQLLETAQRVFSRGWKKMKLYFMIGLPTEEDEDVEGIVWTGHNAWKRGAQARGDNRGQVTVSVSTFVPKPHTPFQWAAMNDYDEVRRKQRILRDAARRSKVQLKVHDSKGSWLEGVLARGDRRLAQVISDAFDRGCRFDSWDDQLKLDVWSEAMQAHTIDTEGLLGTFPVTARLPWDHLDVGLEDGFLAREYRKALKNRLSPPCGKAAGMFVHHTNVAEAKADTRRLVCYDCGIACDMTEMREERLVRLRVLGAEEPRRQELPVETLEAVEHGETIDALETDETIDTLETDAPSRAAADAERATESEHPRPASAPSDGQGDGPVPYVQVPHARASQGERMRMRLSFTKTGRFAFHGHLDLVRLFPRMFRQLDMPLYYSEGFHPRPEMTFSPALSLGIPSLGEFLDLKLRAGSVTEADVGPLLERLNGVAFEGVEFTAACILGPNDPALGRILEEAEWVAAIPRAALASIGFDSEEALFERVRSQAALERLEVVRRVKGIGRVIDVGTILRSTAPGEGLPALTRAGFVGDLVPVQFTTWMRAEGSAKPTEVMAALLGLENVDDLPIRFVRSGLFAVRDGQRHSPMRLEAFRNVPSKRADGEARDPAPTTDAEQAQEGAP
ncbi:MAG: TIGR03960 family B12-binding radical SAM protein [Polyangiales bacterium]